MIQYLPTLTTIDLDQWHKLVNRSDNASFFQTYECYLLYTKEESLLPFVSGVMENGFLVGLILGYTLSHHKLPACITQRSIIPGGILTDKNMSNEALGVLLENNMRTNLNKSIYCEIRNYSNYESLLPILDKHSFHYYPHLNYIIEPSSIEQAYGQLNKGKKRQVKQSEKEGCTCYPTRDEKEIESFYLILKDLYKNKIKLPLFSQSFFKAIANSPNGKIWVVKHQKKIVGGMATVELPNSCIYEWFVCGEDTKYKDIFPSVMATWSVIKYAMEKGIRFDFMGAGAPKNAYGVRKFKAAFGGKLVEYGRCRNVQKPILYNIGKWIVKSKQYINTIK